MKLANRILVLALPFLLAPVTSYSQPAKMYFICTNDFGDGPGWNGDNLELGFELTPVRSASNAPTAQHVRVGSGAGWIQHSGWVRLDHMSDLGHVSGFEGDSAQLQNEIKSYEASLKPGEKCGGLETLGPILKKNVLQYMKDFTPDSETPAFNCGDVGSRGPRQDIVVNSVGKEISFEAGKSIKAAFLREPVELKVQLSVGGRNARNLPAILRRIKDEEVLGFEHSFAALELKGNREEDRIFLRCK